MNDKKTKAIEKIEDKMKGLDSADPRYMVLEKAKNFKISWVDLGQSLYMVWKEKLYKDWGFVEFDNYAKKEIGIRKDTALKLLRSYNFMEEKYPKYLDENYKKEVHVGEVPTYEAVDVLRRASRNKDLEKEDYKALEKDVFEKGRDAREVAKNFKNAIEEMAQYNDDDLIKKKKLSRLKRLISLMKSVRKEIRDGQLLPKKVMDELNASLVKLEEAVVLEAAE